MATCNGLQSVSKVDATIAATVDTAKKVTVFISCLPSLHAKSQAVKPLFRTWNSSSKQPQSS
eukprot:4885100-Amphidinium_carterae.1